MFNSPKFLKALVSTLKLLALFLFLYLLLFPFFPELRYRLSGKADTINHQEFQEVSEEAQKYKSQAFPVAEDVEVSEKPFNQLIIPKIGVNIPIVATKNEEYGLSMGAWLMPIGSTPDKGGNTIITGHRFRYLPPSNLTFYLFHKLQVGDIYLAVWQGIDYYYRIREIKIVDPSDGSPHEPSDKSIMTMYTCHPIYSTDKRLVIISDLIVNDEEPELTPALEELENL